MAAELVAEVRSASRSTALYAFAVAAILAAFTTIAFWDVFHFAWIRGYDAWAIGNYEYAIQVHHRLPTAAESDVWHNPPFFFFLAALLQEFATRIGNKADPYKAVQLMSLFSALGVCVFAFFTSRELWPRSRGAQLAALALAATTPVLVRGAVLYHPDPLTAFLIAAVTFILVRTFVRERFTFRAAVGAGVLLGLANLTRSWALAALAAAVIALAASWWWRGRDRAVLRFAVVLFAVTGLLFVPWLGYETAKHGTPFPYSQPDPSQWQQHTRPASFYVGLDVGKAFTHPYTDEFRNRIFPVTYTDWWGDYWRDWDVPSAETSSPPILTGHLDSERRLQSYLGIAPSILMIVGVVTLGIAAVRRRSAALVFVVASLVCLAVAYTGFLAHYPKRDGDNMKALYVLDAALPLAVCGGWVVERLRLLVRNRIVLAALAFIALDLAYIDAKFLILG